ncbi:hypothetical protein [Bacteroides cellulosilyticus]|uniref:hypothetical protein n=1 Tax=Bacteroides cellulosilyticus TaxID=246787 RepID=UPI0032C0901F
MCRIFSLCVLLLLALTGAAQDKRTLAVGVLQTARDFRQVAPVWHIISRQEDIFRFVEKPCDFDPFGQTGFAHLWLQYD